MSVSSFLLMMLSAAVGALLVYSRGYATENGKNLAIREDLDSVTGAVEQVKAAAQGLLEREKAALAHEQLVNRTQYELELTAYREVWMALLPVHRAAVALRPVFDYGLVAGETEQGRKQERLKAFSESFYPFRDVVWQHRPFYPPEVFSSLNSLVSLMFSEAIAYQRFDPNRQDYWDKALANATSINEQVDSLAETIRQRLSRVRVA